MNDPINVDFIRSIPKKLIETFDFRTGKAEYFYTLREIRMLLDAPETISNDTLLGDIKTALGYSSANIDGLPLPILRHPDRGIQPVVSKKYYARLRARKSFPPYDRVLLPAYKEIINFPNYDKEGLLLDEINSLKMTQRRIMRYLFYNRGRLVPPLNKELRAAMEYPRSSAKGIEATVCDLILETKIRITQFEIYINMPDRWYILESRKPALMKGMENGDEK